MAKAKCTLWGLRLGHPNPFRRTITVGKGRNEERATLVFEPKTPYELSEGEVAQLKTDIDNGIIVPWDEDQNDFRQRLRPGNQIASKPTENIADARLSGSEESGPDTPTE